MTGFTLRLHPPGVPRRRDASLPRDVKSCTPCVRPRMRRRCRCCLPNPVVGGLFRKLHHDVDATLLDRRSRLASSRADVAVAQAPATPSLRNRAAPAGWPRHISDRAGRAPRLLAAGHALGGRSHRHSAAPWRSRAPTCATRIRHDRGHRQRACGQGHAQRGAGGSHGEQGRHRVVAGSRRVAAAGIDAAAKSSLRIVSLDRLQASLAASKVPPRVVQVDNAPPRVIVSTTARDPGAGGRRPGVEAGGRQSRLHAHRSIRAHSI